MAVLLNIVVVPSGLVPSIAITELAQLFFSRWELAVAYAARFSLLWIAIFFDDLVAEVFNAGVSELVGKLPIVSKQPTAYEPDQNTGCLLVCIDFAVSSVWPPLNIIGWLG